eukprot:scaffold7266_cov129-Isochrysis_galbana.AAC.1
MLCLTGFYPKKGGVESTTAGCNGGRCLVVPCERIGEWAVRVPPVGQRRLRRSPPALRPRIRRRRMGGPRSAIPICVAPVNVIVR